MSRCVQMRRSTPAAAAGVTLWAPASLVGVISRARRGAAKLHACRLTHYPTLVWLGMPATTVVGSTGCLGRVAEWQTRWLQVPVSFGTWGFKSPFAHKIDLTVAVIGRGVSRV
jgi:hypothetical protein